MINNIPNKDKNFFISIGKKAVQENPFYNTLNLFLKYYFVDHYEKEFFITKFIKNIIKNEDEFQVFLIFKEYCLDVFHNKIIYMFKFDEKIDDITYAIIGYVKTEYDKDRTVIKPFIQSLSENKDEILEKFNFIKSNYIFKHDLVSKFKKLEEPISYLEKAREHEEKAKYYNNLALESLKDIKNNFENSFKNLKIDDSAKILMVKNK